MVNMLKMKSKKEVRELHIAFSQKDTQYVKTVMAELDAVKKRRMFFSKETSDAKIRNVFSKIIDRCKVLEIVRAE